eukprot:4001428-Amphidinium_carterae.1
MEARASVMEGWRLTACPRCKSNCVEQVGQEVRININDGVIMVFGKLEHPKPVTLERYPRSENMTSPIGKIEDEEGRSVHVCNCHQHSRISVRCRLTPSTNVLFEALGVIIDSEKTGICCDVVAHRRQDCCLESGPAVAVDCAIGFVHDMSNCMPKATAVPRDWNNLQLA